MYFVKYGEKYLHDPRIGLTLPSATLDTEINRSDVFSFTIPATHDVWNSIIERDRNNLVTVLSDSTILFRGEVTSVKEDFQRTKSVECRGELAYLNDSIVRPYSTYEGESTRTVPSTVDGYFDFLISEHNSQVDDSKKFSIGENQGSRLDYNNYIYRADTSYPTVGETIKSKIIESLGGYLRLDYLPNGERSISLIEEYQTTNAQIIDFGVNLLDFINDVDSVEMATFVIPIGSDIQEGSDEQSDKQKICLDISTKSLTPLKEWMDYKLVKYGEAQANSQEADNNRRKVYEDPESTEEQKKSADDRLTAALEAEDEAKNNYEVATAQYNDACNNSPDRMLENNFNDGRTYYKYGDIIYCGEAVNRYGWIGQKVEHSDITYMSNLITYGMTDLKSLMEPFTTIEIKAIDLSIIKPDYTPITIGQYIRARSKPHNFDSYMLCSKIVFDIIKPDNNTFTLGTVYQTLTGQSNKKINSLNQAINDSDSKISNEYRTTSKNLASVEKQVINTETKVVSMDSQVTKIDTDVKKIDTTVQTINTQVSATNDYVIAQGKTGLWTWRKWNSGVAEAWGEGGLTWSSDGMSGNMYYKTVNTDLPSGVFMKQSSVRTLATVQSTARLFSVNFTKNSTNESLEYYVFSPTSDPIYINVEMHLLGRWKEVKED